MNTKQKQELFNKVSTYKDMEDYLNTNVYETVEEFDVRVEQGDYQIATRGVYNGALHKFTPNTLNAEELVGALQQYLYEDDYMEFLYLTYEAEDDLGTFEQLTLFDVLEDYLNCHDVFTIGNNIYINVI